MVLERHGVKLITEDGTEHDWKVLTVREQGQMLPAGTLCVVCGLTAKELFDDEMARTLRSTRTEFAPGVGASYGGAPVSSLANGVDTSLVAPISAEQRGVQAMNLMFSGIALDLDSKVEG